VTLVVLPLFHQFGTMVAIAQSLTVGHQVVLMSQFSPSQYVRLVNKYKVDDDITVTVVVVVVINIITMVHLVVVVTVFHHHHHLLHHNHLLLLLLFPRPPPRPPRPSFSYVSSGTLNSTVPYHTILFLIHDDVKLAELFNNSFE